MRTYQDRAIQLHLEVIQESQVKFLSQDKSLPFWQNQSSPLVRLLDTLQELGRDIISLILRVTDVDLSAVVLRWVMVRVMLLEFIAILWEVRWIAMMRIRMPIVVPLNIGGSSYEGGKNSEKSTDGGKVEEHGCGCLSVCFVRESTKSSSCRNKRQNLDFGHIYIPAPKL